MASDLNKLLALEEPFTKDVIVQRCNFSEKLEKLRRFRFPDGLSSLAMDLTSIICSSASLERVFSTLHGNNVYKGISPGVTVIVLDRLLKFTL